jgi:hypothetical protein
MKNLKIHLIVASLVFCAFSATAQHWYMQDNYYLYEDNYLWRIPKNVEGFQNATVQTWSPVAQSWTNVRRLKPTYHASGRLDKIDLEVWRNNIFVPQWQHFFFYNPVGRLENLVVQTPNFVNSWQELYTFSGNNVTFRTTQIWDSIRWRNSMRDSNVFVNNRLYMSFLQEWFTGPGLPSIWGGDRRDSITYDDNARTKNIFQQAWVVFRFASAQRDAVSYDAQGRRSELRRDFIVAGQLDSFYRVLRWTYNYNAQGKFSRLLRQQWNNGANRWDDHTQVIFSYDANGKITEELVQIMAVAGWQNSTRVIYLNAPNGINDWANDLKISVSPNPANTFLNIAFVTDNEAIKTVKMFDMSGKLVKSWKNEAQTPQMNVGTEGVQNGVFMLQIETSKGTANKKVVIQH